MFNILLCDKNVGGEANMGRALNFVRSNILSEINLSNRITKNRNIVVLISTDKSIDEAKDAAIKLKNDGLLYNIIVFVIVVFVIYVCICMYL